MAFDEALAGRIRKRMAARSDVVERKMFGGLAFLVRGDMCFGIIGSDLMVRVGRDDFERLLADADARPMDFTGRPSRGMLYVSPEGVRTNRALGTWLARALRYVLALPPKTSQARRRPPDIAAGSAGSAADCHKSGRRQRRQPIL